MSKDTAFADTLKELREAAGFADVAAVGREVIRLGYLRPSYFDIRRYELGETKPNVELFAALIDALGLSQREVMMLVRAAGPTRLKQRSKV